MGKHEKTLRYILLRRSDSNVSFADVCSLLIRLGFNERIAGSHHIFSISGVNEILNLQARKGFAKAYQVKQIREIVLKYNLKLDG
jgi:hypothetical protein